MELRKILAICLTIVTLASCGDSSKEKHNASAIRGLAEKHVTELKAPQLLQEYLLSLDNDTTVICYALVMPRQTLIRLMAEETYPTQGGLEKIRENLVNRYVYGREYIDSCANDKKDDKDWLMNNIVNEPINPIWEQLVHD